MPMNMKKSLIYICLLGSAQGVFGAAADYIVPDSYAGQKIRPGSIYDLWITMQRLPVLETVHNQL